MSQPPCSHISFALPFPFPFSCYLTISISLQFLTNSLTSVSLIRLKVDLTKYIEEHLFTFDNAFGEEKENNQIYDLCVKPLVSETFKGAKTTCFAYGQTGSGKTFTMMGTSDGVVPGLYTLAAYDIIHYLH